MTLVWAVLAGLGLGAAPPPSEAQASLLDGLGAHHRKVTTRSAQAQRYFDQGLRLLYAFNLEEAQRSFEEAARLDPSCASCHWGVAMSLGPHINLPAMPDRTRAAQLAAQKAGAAARRAAPVERALIDAVTRRYSDPPPADAAAQKALDLAYAEAMREVMRRFPEDLDVAAFFVEAMMDLRPWDLWTSDGQPQPGTLEIVSTLERILARDPRHPGANHYYIHAVEASPHPEKGVAAAERIGDLMPSAGHLVHMPAHIYARVGRYADASAVNRRAIQVDDAYMAAGRPPGFYMMYVAHNPQFLMSSSMMEGRSADALAAARDTVSRAPVPMLRAMPGFDLVLAYPVWTMARFGRWQDVLLEPAPPPDFTFATGMWHTARGLALAATDRLDEAAGEAQALAAATAATPADATEANNSARALLGIASDLLAGEIAVRKGEIAEGIRRLKDAVRGEDALRYNEPSDWPYPVRHTLGAVLLMAGHLAEAEAVYKTDLERNRENGWALFGLATSLRVQRKTAEAEEVRRRFEQAWKNADVKLTASRF